MSRTDKDVPYWVRKNREGTSTHHDHLHFGEEIVTYRDVLDKHGQPTYTEIPVYQTANSILKGDPNDGVLFKTERGEYRRNWFHDNKAVLYKTDHGTYLASIHKEAHRLVSALRGEEMVRVGYVLRKVRERVVLAHVADHCTEGENCARGGYHDPAARAMPCTPELSGERPWYYFGNTSQRALEHANYFTADRTRVRDHNRALTKLANAGYDLEDYDENEVLDGETRSIIYW